MARGITALPALMARGRLPQPTSVTEAKEAFILASDGIRAWIQESETVNMNPEGWADRHALYLEYRSYADDVENSPSRSAGREFYNRLEQIKGITRCKKNVEGFKGIELLGPPSGGQP